MSPLSKINKYYDLLLWTEYLYITGEQILVYFDTYHASTLAPISPIFARFNFIKNTAKHARKHNFHAQTRVYM